MPFKQTLNCVMVCLGITQAAQCNNILLAVICFLGRKWWFLCCVLRENLALKWDSPWMWISKKVGQQLPKRWRLEKNWGGSFLSWNEAGYRLGAIKVCQELLVIEACLSAHCQQGNHGQHLKWLTSDLFINLTRALGFVLALVRGNWCQ